MFVCVDQYYKQILFVHVSVGGRGGEGQSEFGKTSKKKKISSTYYGNA